jgi:hypothetical protein
MTISKSTAWKIAAGLVSIFLLWQGYSFTKGMWIDWAMRQAKEKHEAEIAALQVKIDASKAAYNNLAEHAAREREEIRLKAEAEKRKADNAFAILRSESSAELRKRNATISQVLTEKEKDEKALTVAKGSINYLLTLEFATLWAWKISDENMGVAHAEVVAGLEMKYQACAKWTTVLEKRLKLNQSHSFWKQLAKYATYGAIFESGRRVGRIGK